MLLSQQPGQPYIAPPPLPFEFLLYLVGLRSQSQASQPPLKPDLRADLLRISKLLFFLNDADTIQQLTNQQWSFLCQ